MATLEELMAPPVIKKVISQLKTPQTRLQDFYGLGPGQANTDPIGGKNFAFDTFDHTRKLAVGRGHGTGPAQARRQPVGNISGKMWRSFESLPISYDEVFRHRPLGQGFGNAEVDARGERYIGKQNEELAQRFKNAREVVIAKMFTEGAFGVLVQGLDFIIVAQGAGTFDISFQHPASNRTDVGGTFTLDWVTNKTTVAAVSQLMALNQLSAKDTGYPIKHAWCNSTTWGKVIDVTDFQNKGGSSLPTFSMFERTGLTGPDGVEDTGFTAMLRAVPWLTWHIYDDVLEVNGTEVELLPNNDILFTPDPGDDWLEMQEGSEIVRQTESSPEFEAFGMSGWITPKSDPAGVVLKYIDNFMVAPPVPKAWYIAEAITV